VTNENVLPDPSTPFGESVRRRLRDEEVIWLTTVGPSGTPQPNPVWFLWQEDEPGSESGGGSFLIYHLDTAARLKTFQARPRVSLNFNTVGGGGVVVFSGEVEILEGHPPAHEVPDYAAKYEPRVADISENGLEGFMSKYSVVTRIRPTRVRGF